MRSETVTSLIGALDVIRANGVEARVSVQIGGYVARNRNALVEIARENNSSHIMFIDNDQTFKPSAIQRLVDADKDIVVDPYNARPSPGRPLISTLKMMDKDGNLPMDGSMADFEIPAGLFKVGAAGTGFMLIKMSVFDKLKKPYFVAWEDEKGEHHTEDVEFCVNARKVGFDVWANPTIPVGHIGNVEVKVEIDNAANIAGWMSYRELKWLAKQAQKHERIVEIGSYMGRSTRALAENTKGVVYAIDNFLGPSEKPALFNFPIYEMFMRSNIDLIQQNRIVTIAADHAEATVPITPDMVFIDGDHHYESVKRDINMWLPRLQKGGLLCGHDIQFKHVKKAVDETIGKYKVGRKTTIWYITKKGV